jgi:predicted ATP-grasp superfamily ATP-dependent carboligase
MSRATAIVLGMGGNGLGVVRSLGRCGVPVVAMNPVNDAAMKSKYCQSIICPDVEEEGERLLQFMLEQGRELDQPGILFPTGDAYVEFVSENRDPLSEHYRFALPRKETMRRLLNKRTQYMWAKELEIPLPRSYFPSSEEDLQQLVDEIEYPAIIKAASSVEWRRTFGVQKVILVGSKTELLESFERIAKLGMEIVIQEVVLGEDDRCYKICSYLDNRSEAVLSFTLRKLRNYPCRFGVGSCVESCSMPEVADLGLKFLRGVNYVGIGSIEFKRDTRDGKLKMIELNSRLWWQNSLAEKCGLNFPYTMYCNLIGEEVEEKSSFRNGVKWVSMSSDYASFKEYRGRGELTTARWLQSLQGERVYEIFAWDDVSPYLHITKYGLGPLEKLIKKAARRIRG